jgi:hypothetical protein
MGCKVFICNPASRRAQGLGDSVPKINLTDRGTVSLKRGETLQ